MSEVSAVQGAVVLFEVQVRQWNTIQEVELELQINAFKDTLKEFVIQDFTTTNVMVVVNVSFFITR